MIQTSFERGTAFSIDVDHREYWITAKHLLTGAKHPPFGWYTSQSATISILTATGDKQSWLTEKFAVIDPGKDIDILVLVPSRLLTDKINTVESGSVNIGLGGDCEFLGFPYGGGWRAKFSSGESVWLPYVKHCTVSAVIHEDTTVFVLDGINNVGFSGGPILFGTGDQQKVFAVVSGFHTEPAEIIPNTEPIPTPTGLPVNKDPQKPDFTSKDKFSVNVNSGFMTAYDLDSALVAIRKTPIGPLRN